MEMRRKPQPFTIDEVQTATLILTEGGFECVETRPGYVYPRVRIAMCDREALLPAERTFKTKIGARAKRRNKPRKLRR